MIFLLALLLMLQPAPEMSIRDCLLRSGYSHEVYDSDVADIRGVNAWAGQGETVILHGRSLGWWVTVPTDTGDRAVSFYAWRGDLFAFVFMHPDDPGRGIPPVWHGDCFLRLTP